MIYATNFLSAAFLAALLSACSGGSTSPPVVKSVEVSPATVELRFPSRTTAQLVAAARDARGVVLTGHDVTWRSSAPGVVSVSSSGVVTAAGEGSATVTATVSGIAGTSTIQVLPAAVATVTVSLGSTGLGVADTVRATAALSDSAGNALTGRVVQWSSSNAIVASVSATGLVTALSVGVADIMATSEGMTGVVQVRVFGSAPNLTLDNVYLTQAVQRYGGGVPLLIGGNPVLVNVFGTLDRPFVGGLPLPRLRITVFKGASQLLVDERPISRAVGPSVNPDSPIHQIVLPATIVSPGLQVVATIDPDSTLPEATLADNRWPRSGVPQEIPVQAVAPLPVHFVPIYLSNGGSVGTVTAANLSQYLYATRQMHPVTTIDATIGATFSTDVNFGSGAATPWLTILQQLDALRVAEGSSKYYVGALRPPPGVTYVQYGGYGYIPDDPQSYGPSTRTAVVVGVGWFNRQRQTTELVAHELAHTMGRMHAPCGGAAAPDPAYPYASAAIGAPGHDLYTYSFGEEGLPTVYFPFATSDVMSYCTPAWISDHTYEALLRARSTTTAGAGGVSGGSQCECLIVWGSVDGDSVHLEPAFVTRTRVSLPERRGAFQLEGLTGAGSRIFAYDFEAARIDHAPDVRHFAFAIPLDGGTREALSRLRLNYRGHTVELSPRTTFRGLAERADAAVRGLTLSAVGADEVEVRWNARDFAGAIVRDAASGRVLGIGTSGTLRVLASSSELEVVLSDGVRSASRRLARPSRQ